MIEPRNVAHDEKGQQAKKHLAPAPTRRPSLANGAEPKGDGLVHVMQARHDALVNQSLAGIRAKLGLPVG